MNCLELRRMAMIDPHQLGEAATAHAEKCEACRDYLARTFLFETELAIALRVPAPDGARERAVYNALSAPASKRSRWLALAASFLLAVALGAALVWPRNDPMALAGIDFVVFEEAQAILDAKPVDPEALKRVVAQLGISLPDQLGELRYTGTCPFAGGMAHHIVAKTPMGKVTLLLLPERSVSVRAVATARGLEAIITPVAGGSVAIVSNSALSIERAEMMLKSSPPDRA